MRLYKRKKLIPNKGILISFLFSAIVVIYSIIAFSNVSHSVDNQEKEALEKAINHAIVSCYAIEGIYPKDFTYLEDNYGIVVNYEKYKIDYQVIASNIRPSFQVLVIGGIEE